MALNGKRQASTIPKEQFYVNPEDLRREIKLFYETDKCSTTLGNYINKIAQGLSHSPGFHNYTYIDEMVGDAIVKMYSALKYKKFNVDSDTSPFSYFTTIAFHAFINRIKREKRHFKAVEDFKADHYEKLLTTGEIHDERYNIYTRPCDDDGEYYDE